MLEPEGEDLLLICYPPDEAVASGVQTALDDMGGSGRDAAEAVELRLRQTYPQLRIVVHEPRGTAATDQTTWVVFRDRHEWRSHGREREGQQDGQFGHDRRDRQPVVLVVDDEPLVLLLTSTVLASRGWHVIQASDGLDALAETEGIDLDLLITDYDMPGIDGRELAHRLCERDSSLPVIVVSGNPQASDWIEGARHAFLAKLFSIGDLALRVEWLTGCPTAWTGCNESAGG